METTSAAKASRVRPRWARKAPEIPARRARSKPGAVSTLENTTPIAPPSSPRFKASIRACRFEPRPLMRTPIVFMTKAPGRKSGPPASLLPGDSRASHHVADHEARLGAPLERVLDVVEVRGRDDDHHAD